MKTFLVILMLVLVAVLEMAAVPFFGFWGANLNLFLVLLLLLTVFMTFEKTWWWVVLAGLFLDSFSGLPFGTISFSLILTIFIINWLRRSIFSETKLWISVSLVALGTLLYYLFLTGLSGLLSFLGEGEAVSYFSFSFGSFASILLGVGLNLIAAIILFYLIRPFAK